jgi:LPS-assembly protein
MLKSHFLSGLAAALLLCSLRSHAESEVTPIEPATIGGALGLTGTSVEANADALIIEGDKLELHLDREMRAIGNAKISRGKQNITGDLIDYNIQNDELSVTGNASINVGNAQLTGHELHMHLSESIGEIKDASISIIENAETAETKKTQTNIKSSEKFSKSLGSLQSQQIGGASAYSLATEVSEAKPSQGALGLDSDESGSSRASNARGDAKSIIFEGQDRKTLKNARFTTCAAGVDDWYIKANELNLNDYSKTGVAKNAYIEFKGVPLIYTPWISFSFSNQRKSGLLAPAFGTTSKSGFELTTPFYWNISPNMDATFATRVLSKRGVQLQGEFRYLEDNFSGIDNIEYLPSDNQTGQNRYYANFKHQQSFSNGWSAGYSIEKVSDNKYFADMSTRIVTTSQVTLPQQFNVYYADDIWRFNALAQKFQTLDNLSYPYERLPQLTLSGNKDYGDLNANLYTQLVTFDTNKNAPVNVTGSRFTIYPSISLPMNKTYGYITPKIGIHHTSYSLNNDPNNNSSLERTLPIASIDGGLFFDRDFKIASRNYTQTIEPRMFYVYIPKAKQSGIPIFDTSDTDLNFSSLFSENQYTGNDRINNANQLSLALTSRLIESNTGIQRLSASIGQRYYFADQTVSLPGATLRKSNSSDIIAGLSSYLKTSWNIDAFWQYNTDDSRSVRTTISSHYAPEPGKALNLSYSYRRDTPGALTNDGLDQFDISGQWPLGKGWYGVGRFNYSLKDSSSVESLAGFEYNAGCWQARTVIQRVSTATANANYALFFQLELGGLASIGTNPLSVIKRNVPGYVNSSRIPDANQQPYYE